MSVAAASTAPRKSSTVKGFKPSVITGWLFGLGRTRRSQGVGLIADERTRSGAAPIPGAPIDFRFVPMGEEAMHDDTAVFRAQSRHRVEQDRDGIATKRQRVLRIKRPLGSRAIEFRLNDEGVR